MKCRGELIIWYKVVPEHGEVPVLVAECIDGANDCGFCAPVRDVDLTMLGNTYPAVTGDPEIGDVVDWSEHSLSLSITDTAILRLSAAHHAYSRGDG